MSEWQFLFYTAPDFQNVHLLFQQSEKFNILAFPHTTLHINIIRVKSYWIK